MKKRIIYIFLLLLIILVIVAFLQLEKKQNNLKTNTAQESILNSNDDPKKELDTSNGATLQKIDIGNQISMYADYAVAVHIDPSLGYDIVSTEEYTEGHAEPGEWLQYVYKRGDNIIVINESEKRNKILFDDAKYLENPVLGPLNIKIGTTRKQLSEIFDVEIISNTLHLYNSASASEYLNVYVYFTDDLVEKVHVDQWID